jgi:hypothetical protein
MALANLTAYLVVLGLPIWLVAEELHRWCRSEARIQGGRAASDHDAAVAPADREPRALSRTTKGDAVKTSRKAVFGIGLGLYLVGFGMLAGVAVERMRFDHKRADILARYDEALRQWQAFRIELERVVDRPSEH